MSVVLIVLAVPFLFWALYLALLAVLAKEECAPEKTASRPLKFDVIVPAHNEALGIQETLRSLREIDYPQELWRIVVVADNCTDDTAALARAEGATVLERSDLVRRGKGYALEYAFGRCLSDGFCDTVVVVDADSVVSRNLLTAFARRFAAGAAAVQAEYSVKNPAASWRTRLMSIAFVLFHRVRSLARERMGLSAGLRGNAMGFSAGLMRAVPHRAHSIVEDAEYGILIGLKGHRVWFVSDAQVWGDMPATAEASVSQRRRWEGGRMGLIKAHLPKLLAGAWRSKVLLDLAIDLCVPPLSYLVLGAVAGFGLSAAFSATVAMMLFGGAAVALFVYVLRGFLMSDANLKDLAYAPYYVAWKLRLLVSPKDRPRGEWVRTRRTGEL